MNITEMLQRFLNRKEEQVTGECLLNGVKGRIAAVSHDDLARPGRKVVEGTIIIDNFTEDVERGKVTFGLRGEKTTIDVVIPAYRIWANGTVVYTEYSFTSIPEEK